MQGLLVDPEEVTSTYEYEICEIRTIFANGGSECNAYTILQADVAPLIPPFSYNNLCSSTLVTVFIPVYVFVYCIELVISPVYVLVFMNTKYSQYSAHIKRAFLHGVFWPQHWEEEGGSATEPIDTSPTTPGAIVNNADNRADPRKLLKTNRIVTIDVLNNFLVFFTFGMCSPFLAVLMLVSVTMKYAMWITVIGRFVRIRVVSKPAERIARDKALQALSDACIPLRQLVTDFVWPTIWCSAVFFSFLCWDVYGDRVGWKEGAWVPAVVISGPVILWLVVGCIVPSDGHVEVANNVGRHITEYSSAIVSSPLRDVTEPTLKEAEMTRPSNA